MDLSVTYLGVAFDEAALHDVDGVLDAGAQVLCGGGGAARAAPGLAAGGGHDVVDEAGHALVGNVAQSLDLVPDELLLAGKLLLGELQVCASGYGVHNRCVSRQRTIGCGKHPVGESRSGSAVKRPWRRVPTTCNHAQYVDDRTHLQWLKVGFAVGGMACA